MTYVNIWNQIIDQVFARVEQEGESVRFYTNANDDTPAYSVYHSQDCCETVYIESIVGELSDLENSPILMAERVTQDVERDKCDNESATWTFIKFATFKGYVTIRFYGSSNGYYSETANLSEGLGY